MRQAYFRDGKAKYGDLMSPKGDTWKNQSLAPEYKRLYVNLAAITD
jgi:hypothetical protein